ncbi:hypothetical protein [Paenarthrobacter ureafaciens]
MGTVNAALIGLLVGSALLVAGLAAPFAVGAGVMAGLAFLVTSLFRGKRRYDGVWRKLTSISPAGGGPTGDSRKTP